ncbi:CsbD family protein [Paeniglutamicibacter kerguelensis]|uniref:Uncharacterized protein n=1 Tax=Paeniglutamicibacter kerguelensis TaxID=254788 RepID=A0ABS4XD14_9MICC|nr:CsbD family protein [Paeniglutamicibacter kerguelensis]MBP2386251.1 hypothetical protein [Paeniglutamicibacter kerguelensis]
MLPGGQRAARTTWAPSGHEPLGGDPHALQPPAIPVVGNAVADPPAPAATPCLIGTAVGAGNHNRTTNQRSIPMGAGDKISNKAKEATGKVKEKAG